MNQIKEYEVGINSSNKMYFIDSNVLLAMCKFYYRGKCNGEDGVTEELKKFIIKARRQRIQNDFSINEVCYDYTLNAINVEQMNKIMIAYDNLIMNMSDNEIMKHKGTTIPQAKRNLPPNYTFKSIFDCKLPTFLFRGIDDMPEAFYIVYLYFLKIYSLYFEPISSMKKIEKLFDFMTDEINIFMGLEFYLAVLLFIGQKSEHEIAERIFKPVKNPTLDHVLNAVMDIFQYRMVCYIVDSSIKEKVPINAIFVTMDKALQKYIEHNVSYNMVMSTNMITPVNFFNAVIKDEYVNEWENFYNNKYYLCIKLRFMRLHEKTMSSQERDKILNAMRQCIVKYELELFN